MKAIYKKKWLVTSDGKIFIITKNGLKETGKCLDRAGYKRVGINGKNETLHTIVGKCFVKCYFENACIDHKDGNKLNNNINNLEWVTRSENVKRAWENNQIKTRKKVFWNEKVFNSVSEMSIELGFTRTYCATRIRRDKEILGHKAYYLENGE